MKNIQFTIITFYQFKKNINIVDFQIFLKEFCSINKIKGTILLANEGINGTVAGLLEPINLLEKELSYIGFNDLEKKKSMHNFMPFNRLKIKIKKEIVTFGQENLDIEKLRGQDVEHNKWNELINDNETVLIDVRNKFEVEVGTFKGAINPNTKNFSDFKKFIEKDFKKEKNKKIAIFCTGGIRCEKASSFMKNKGFKNIYQLKGGVLKYLESTPTKKSLWKGECFVFDSRVSVQNEMKVGTYTLCHACRNPLNTRDRRSKYYEKGISCPKCVNKTSKDKKFRLKERNKQIEIAKKKGLYSPYIKFTPTDFS
jgi:UPF0176 protein